MAINALFSLAEPGDEFAIQATITTTTTNNNNNDSDNEHNKDNDNDTSDNIVRHPGARGPPGGVDAWIDL